MRHARGVAIDGTFEWLPASEKHDRVIFNMTPTEEQFCRANSDTITPDTYSRFISLAGMPEYAS